MLGDRLSIDDVGTPKNKLSKSTVSRVRQDEYFLGIVRVSRTDAPYILEIFCSGSPDILD